MIPFNFQKDEYDFDRSRFTVRYPSRLLGFPWFTDGLPDWMNVASMVTIIGRDLTDLTTRMAGIVPKNRTDKSWNSDLRRVRRSWFREGNILILDSSNCFAAEFGCFA